MEKYKAPRSEEHERGERDKGESKRAKCGRRRCVESTRESEGPHRTDNARCKEDVKQGEKEKCKMRVRGETGPSKRPRPTTRQGARQKAGRQEGEGEKS